MTTSPKPEYDYSKHTVKELKAMMNERNVLTWNACRVKADYISALEKDDRYRRHNDDFMSSITNLTDAFKKQKEDNEKAIQKIRETCKKADLAIKILEEKEDKTIEDYQKLVDVMKTRMKLMKDW